MHGWDHKSPSCSLLVMYMCITPGEEGWVENKHWAVTCVYISLFWNSAQGGGEKETNESFEARG